nr:transmembrane protein [Pohorje myodes paramyxovirus 1]
METIYEDKVSEPTYYETTSSAPAIYKATQLRRGQRYRYNARTIQNIKTKEGTAYSTVITAIGLTIQVFVFVTLCYLLITYENADRRGCRIDGTKVKIDFKDLDERLDQLNMNVNTLLNAITFTLPQVLNTNRGQIIQRINYLMHEMRELIKLNSMTLDVRMGLNKTLNFKTGGSNMNIVKATTEVYRTTTPRSATDHDITLVPRFRHTAIPFYPLTKVDTEEESSKNPLYEKSDRKVDDYEKEAKLFDYSNMSPFF